MTEPRAKLTQIPSSIAAVADYESFARERVSEQAWAYLAGAAGDETTLRENCAAYQRLRLDARVLRDLSGGHTRLDLFGRTFAFPMILAPVAYHKLFHPDGEMATVMAASAIQAGMIVSTQASVPLEDIARAAQAPLWFQLYIQHDRAFTSELIARAEGAGYGALVVTVDAPVNGLRNREQRAVFALPADVSAVNLRGMVPSPRFEGRAGADVLLLGGPLLAAAPTWRDLAWLRSQTRLPILIKGVMNAEDARRAVAEGMNGIVVSNHGGRTLDTLPATIDVLPDIVAAINGDVPVLMDGGIRRGTDVLKALALGAKAVLIGRPYVHGLAAAGAVGVSHVMHILRMELEIAMALAGCQDLDSINVSLIRR